jgi:hypothetical protein
MVSFMILLVASFLLAAAVAYPSGAPKAACDTMVPDKNAHGERPQGVVSPYKVETELVGEGNCLDFINSLDLLHSTLFCGILYARKF